MSAESKKLIPVVQCAVHDRDGRRFAGLVAKRHGAEAQGGHFDAGVP
jgi:hypothetical protein